MLNIVDQIIFNFSNNKSLYIGEDLTIAEHMIQTAMLAEKNQCSDDLICSSLLHDYGHFVIEDPKQLVTDKIDGRHEIIGANYLKKFFHNEIIEPILLHVEAKKYLSRKDKVMKYLILFFCLATISIYAYLSPLPAHQVEIIESIKLDEV